MVLPSIAPISYSPRAVSSISFRSRRLAILHLQQFSRLEQLSERRAIQCQHHAGDALQVALFLPVDVLALVLRESVEEDPAIPEIARDDRPCAAALATARQRDALLEQAAAETRVDKARLHLGDRDQQRAVRHTLLSRPAGKHPGLEGRQAHAETIPLSAIVCKREVGMISWSPGKKARRGQLAQVRCRSEEHT